ncbi:MAG TPA: SAM-dependent methyltransferase [Cytophagales bacterium]|nr:SAM-dependent methyltransferase [Cytophagales bacterium]HAA20006.1 SAM-dependent methyltransferase [Cytophagales bacterium]HAP64668.1 SAM-dependent methyltransferase [Cytophagales bacterium]
MISPSDNTPWNTEFWTQRYQTHQIGWDMGQVSPPLKAYIDQVVDKNSRVLIPGAGHAYEAEYLHQQGFHQVTVIDLSQSPLQNLVQRVPDFPKENLVQGDFFDHEGTYDIILEQTFFCALDPTLRTRYIDKMHSLLAPGGKLAGVLFDIPLFADHPPFGGSRDLYEPLFSARFRFHAWETCHNSIGPRAGNELWINLRKKT